MKLDEAKAECRRYLDHVKRQEQRVIDLQKLAADRRRGLVSDEECRRRRDQIQGVGLTVYDGADLEQAIRVLLKETE